jgi:hypothetical protein
MGSSPYLSISAIEAIKTFLNNVISIDVLNELNDTVFQRPSNRQNLSISVSKS